MSNNLNREISQVFQIDEPKLERFEKIFTDEFERFGDNFTSKYSFSTLNGKHFTGNSIKGVLENDNSLDNPIVNIEIEFATNEEEPEYRGKIEFKRNSDKVKVDVYSNDSKFANRLFDAIDEQVSRLRYEDPVYKVKDKALYLLLFVLVVLVPCTITYLGATTEFGFTERLSKDDISMLLPVFESAKNSDDKVNALFSFYHQLLKNNSSTFTFESAFRTTTKVLQDVKFYILLASIVFVFVSIRNTMRTALGSVFLWGDQLEYVSHTLEKRKFWLGILIGSFLTGIVVNAVTYVVT
ncbi:hypothetical protein AB4543_18415 [Vibrio splendidus]